MYKLIATDLDGTLLDTNRNISPANISSIKKAMSKGMHFVIATGRPIDGIIHFARQLDILHQGQYAISFNGAEVYELNPLRRICSCCITGAEVRRMARKAEELNINYHAFSTTRGLLAAKPNEWTDVEMTLNKIGCTMIDFATIPDDELFQKFMFCGSAEEVEGIQDKVDEYREDYTVTRSAFCFLEVLNKQASKGNGLKLLCETIGIPQEETVSFGDEQNDISMIEYAGLGVAMANAVPEVKKVANLITDTNLNDGLSKVLEQIIRDQYR